MNAHASRLRALGFVLLSVVLVGSLWTVPYLPTNDGPESVLAVHMENHFGDPGVIYPEVFEPTLQFAGRGFTILFEPLEEVFGWQRGLQVALSVIVLLQAWGFVALLRTLEPRRLSLAFLGFPLALSWTLYMGFFAFTLASAGGLFILAFALRDPPPGPFARGLVALLLLLQAGCHMFAALLTGFVLLAFAVVRAPRARRLAEAGKTLLTGLPAALLVLTAVRVARTGAVGAAFSGGFGQLPFVVVLATWPRTVAPGAAPVAYLVTLGVVLAIGFTVVRACRETSSTFDRAAAGTALFLILASLLTPRDLPGWQLVSQRFITLGLLLTVAALPLERGPSWLAPAVFTASFAWTALAYPFHHRLAAASRDAIDGLRAPVKRERIWLPIQLDPFGFEVRRPWASEVPFREPLHHIAALYATVEGGLTPYSFASNPASWPFGLRKGGIRPPPVPNLEEFAAIAQLPAFRNDPAVRTAELDVLATYGTFYEGILVTGGRPSDLEHFHERGFVADWEQGTVLVGHFEPCRIEVLVPAASGRLRVDVGVGESLAVQDVEGAPSDGGIVIGHAPCGTVWVRPHWDTTERDGTVTSKLCAHGDEAGHLSTLVTHAEGRVRCEAVRP